MEFANLDLNKTYTYSDYYGWNFEDRVELINGKVYKMLPAPLAGHQIITGRMYLELGNFLKGKTCSVFAAPFDVRLPLTKSEDDKIYTVLQPDLCVVYDNEKIDRRGCIGAPDIVVEVLSPGNAIKEMKYKYDVYEEAGVKEYWVVFPEQEIVLIYSLIEGKFLPMRPFSVGSELTSVVLPDFKLSITELFKGVANLL